MFDSLVVQWGSLLGFAALIATQVSVTDWHLRIPDPTMADAFLDRFTHVANRIQL